MTMSAVDRSVVESAARSSPDVLEEVLLRSGKLLFSTHGVSIYRVNGDAPFALKVVDGAASRNACTQAATELQCLRRLRYGASSRHLVDVHFAFEMEDRFFFGMQLCARGDLYSLLVSRRLSAADVQLLAAEVACGIGELHRRGFMHGDVKAENVGIDAGGHAQLLDMGLAVELEAHWDDDAGRAQIVTGCGSLPYAAPEVILRAPHGAETDWWGLGVLFFEMAFGHLPFDGSCSEDTGRLICEEHFDDVLAVAVYHEERHWAEHPERLPGSAMFESAATFARALLNKRQVERLGFQAGMDEVEAHPYFNESSAFHWRWADFYEGAYAPEFVRCTS